MDGGRQIEISDVELPIPKEVDHFRKIINKFKKIFIEALEKDTNDGNVQDISRLNSMLERLHHLGNILNLLLSSKDIPEQAKSLKEIDPIIHTFTNEGFTFVNLSDEARELCIYYIKNDIGMYPFDLNQHLSK